jgi:hypothetical protein
VGHSFLHDSVRRWVADGALTSGPDRSTARVKDYAYGLSRLQGRPRPPTPPFS